jgi:hypothetical protein
MTIAFKIGQKVRTTYHLAFGGRDAEGKPVYKDEDRGIAEISVVKSTQFALKRPTGDSWMYFPKRCISRKLIIFVSTATR